MKTESKNQQIGKTVFYKNGKKEYISTGETWEQECDLDWEKTLDGDHTENKSQIGPIRKMRFDSSLVHSLEYNGHFLFVTFVKNAKVYKYPMDHTTAMEIYTAPSVGKAVIAMYKEIKGEEVINN